MVEHFSWMFRHQKALAVIWTDTQAGRHTQKAFEIWMESSFGVFYQCLPRVALWLPSTKKRKQNNLSQIKGRWDGDGGRQGVGQDQRKTTQKSKHKKFSSFFKNSSRFTRTAHIMRGKLLQKRWNMGFVFVFSATRNIIAKTSWWWADSLQSLARADDETD